MPRGKKSNVAASTSDAVATVECIDCKHTYKDINEAMSYHTDESILTHRIKPIKASKKIANVQKVDQSSDDVGETGTPIAPNGVYADQITELARKYPELINPEARELTRGLDVIKEADAILSRAKQNQSQVILKEIPNYEQASKLNNGTLSEYVPHSGNCNGNCKVDRSSNTITVTCSACKSKITVTKR